VVAIGAGWALRAGTPLPTDTVDLELVAWEIGDRQGRPVRMAPGTREQLQSDALLLRAYEREEAPPVWLFVDYHRTQRLGATIHSPRICYPGSGWSVTAAEVAVIGDAGRSPACWLRLRREDEEMVALYWYTSRWGLSAREITLKLQIMRSSLARRTSDAALVRLSTPVVNGDEAAARERLLRFERQIRPRVGQVLPFGEGAS